MAEPADEEKVAADNDDRWDPVDHKLNLTRAERRVRITWWCWTMSILPWICVNAVDWENCRKNGDDFKTCDRSFEGPPSEPPSLTTNVKSAIKALGTHIPGFAAVWRLFFFDISIAIAPFWWWEEGDVRPLLRAFPHIICYLAYYRRPKLVNTALVTLNLLLFYLDAECGRPDLMIIIAYNCKLLHEKLIEMHNSRQTRSVAWSSTVTLETHTRACFLAEPRRRAKEETRAAFGGKERKLARGEFSREHYLVSEAPSTQATRATTIQRIKALFFKALSGGCSEFNEAPKIIEEGRALLVEGGKTAAIAKCTAWLKKASKNYDVLYSKKVAQLQELCAKKISDEEYEAVKKENKNERKEPLVTLLRANGWTSDDGDDDETGGRVEAKEGP